MIYHTNGKVCVEYMKLKELVNRKIGYGIVQPGRSCDGGVPLIKAGNVVSGLNEVSQLDTTDPKNDAKYKRTKLQGGELIVTVVGSVGKTAIVPLNFAGCNLVRATALIDIVDKNDALWVKYFIDSPTGQNYINQNLNTTVQPTLNIKSIEEMDIPMPDKEIRYKVVDLLGNIDSKISINDKINRNLEEQALTLFKNTFLEAENDNREKCRMDEYFDIAIGKTPPRKEKEWFTSNPEDCVWISISDMGNSGTYIYNSSEYLTRAAVDKYNVRVVPNNTVILSFKLTVGRIAITVNETTTNEAIAHFKTDKDNIVEYLYCYLKLFDFGSLGSTSSIGTAVNSKTIKAMDFIVPDMNELNDFYVMIRPIFEQIKILQFENEKLTSLRDSLLPKLMSGDLDVSELDI